MHGKKLNSTNKFFLLFTGYIESNVHDMAVTTATNAQRDAAFNGHNRHNQYIWILPAQHLPLANLRDLSSRIFAAETANSHALRGRLRALFHTVIEAPDAAYNYWSEGESPDEEQCQNGEFRTQSH